MRQRKRRIEALAVGWVAIDADGIRHYAAIVMPHWRARSCDEARVNDVEHVPDGADFNITCLQCASMELP